MSRINTIFTITDKGSSPVKKEVKEKKGKVNADVEAKVSYAPGDLTYIMVNNPDLENINADTPIQYCVSKYRGGSYVTTGTIRTSPYLRTVFKTVLKDVKGITLTDPDEIANTVSYADLEAFKGVDDSENVILQEYFNSRTIQKEQNRVLYELALRRAIKLDPALGHNVVEMVKDFAVPIEGDIASEVSNTPSEHQYATGLALEVVSFIRNGTIDYSVIATKLKDLGYEGITSETVRALAEDSKYAELRTWANNNFVPEREPSSSSGSAMGSVDWNLAFQNAPSVPRTLPSALVVAPSVPVVAPSVPVVTPSVPVVAPSVPDKRKINTMNEPLAVRILQIYNSGVNKSNITMYLREEDNIIVEDDLVDDFLNDRSYTQLRDRAQRIERIMEKTGFSYKFIIDDENIQNEAQKESQLISEPTVMTTKPSFKRQIDFEEGGTQPNVPLVVNPPQPDSVDTHTPMTTPQAPVNKLTSPLPTSVGSPVNEPDIPTRIITGMNEPLPMGTINAIEDEGEEEKQQEQAEIASELTGNPVGAPVPGEMETPTEVAPVQVETPAGAGVDGQNLSGAQPPGYQAVHPDAVGLFFGSRTAPKFNYELFADRIKNGNTLTKTYLFAETKMLIDKFGVDMLIMGQRYGIEASNSQVAKENMEVIQIYFKMKNIHSGTVQVPLKSLIDFRNAIAPTTGAPQVPKPPAPKASEAYHTGIPLEKRSHGFLNKNLLRIPAAVNLGFKIHNRAALDSNVGLSLNTNLGDTKTVFSTDGPGGGIRFKKIDGVCRKRL